MLDERPYPKHGDILFKGDLDIHLNADISFWNKDLSGYAKGYKDTADLVVKGAIERDERSFKFNVSYLVFPVVFLYRQYIELRLKEIIILGIRLSYEKRGFPKIHRIDELWNEARPYILEVISKEHSEAINATEACVKEFSILDPDGMAFRYPVDKEGKPHLPEWSVINLRHLGETMERVGHLLDDIAEVMYINLQQQDELPNY